MTDQQKQPAPNQAPTIDELIHAGKAKVADLGLSPCPYCDATRFGYSSTRDYSSGPRRYSIACSACGANGPMLPTLTEAAAAWNGLVAKITTLRVADNHQVFSPPSIGDWLSLTDIGQGSEVAAPTLSEPDYAYQGQAFAIFAKYGTRLFTRHRLPSMKDGIYQAAIWLKRMQDGNGEEHGSSRSD